MSNKNKLYIVLALLIILFVVSILSTCFGQLNYSFYKCLQLMVGYGRNRELNFYRNYRLNKMFLSIIVGSGMGVSGLVFQSILKNDMSSPGTLGISSGTGFFVLLFLLLFPLNNVNSFLFPVFAFIGGLISALVIFIANYRKNNILNGTKLILTGIALSSFFSALQIALVLSLDKYKLEFMAKWSAGQLWASDWMYIMIIAIWNLFFILIVYYKSRFLNAMNLGSVVSTGIGVNFNKEFIFFSFSAVALSSASVAFGGQFFFIGLIAPHIAKKIVGYNHYFSILVSAFIGALLIVSANFLIAIIPFLFGIPTGIIITIISIPYFIYLLIKGGKVCPA
ncbi:MAG: sugar ABC transporter substrate-binding protein [Treponema sp.]|nr:MAG: sugar ABC transporter substrate-binding protein [Treponema sp.]